MKIEELISGTKDSEEVRIDWTSLPVAVLKKLMNDGYTHIDILQEQ